MFIFSKQLNTMNKLHHTMGCKKMTIFCLGFTLISMLLTLLILLSNMEVLSDMIAHKLLTPEGPPQKMKLRISGTSHPLDGSILQHSHPPGGSILQHSQPSDGSMLQHSSADRLVGGFVLIADSKTIYIRTTSVFYDARQEPVITILALATTTIKYKQIFCHISYNNITEETWRSLKSVQAHITIHDDHVAPFCRWQTTIIRCAVNSSDVPVKVHISLLASVPTAYIKQWFPIKILQPKTYLKKRRFGMCLSTLFNKQDSDVGLLIEWLEMNLMLGAEKIFIYGTFNVSAKYKRVLQYYVHSRSVELILWNLPKRSLSTYDLNHYANDPFVKASRNPKSRVPCIRYFAKSVAYLDCLYQNMDAFDYLFYIDLDEYIIPHMHKTWSDLFSYFEAQHEYKKTGMFVFKEAIYCLDQAPTRGDQELKSVLNITKRLKENRYMDRFGWHFKTVVRPNKIINMKIHYAREVLHGYKTYVVYPRVAQKHHYRQRSKCDKQEQTLVEDNYVRKYESELNTRVLHVYKMLG